MLFSFGLRLFRCRFEVDEREDEVVSGSSIALARDDLFLVNLEVLVERVDRCLGRLDGSVDEVDDLKEKEKGEVVVVVFVRILVLQRRREDD